MKRILSYLALFCFAACGFTGCIREDVPALSETGENRIRLGIPGIERMTRADLDLADLESRVDQLDVLIFDETGGRKYSERLTGVTDEEGYITLGVSRDQFDKDRKYWVYLIANTSFSADAFSDKNLKTLEDLQKLMQRDKGIHMTGLDATVDEEKVPRLFLMDGVAYPKALESEPGAPAAVVLNDSNTRDTELMVKLRRAAAKIVVRIFKGERITFDDYENASGHGCGYYLRNMPVSTRLIAGLEPNADLATPDLNRADYFQWGVEADEPEIEEVRVTAYAYSHNWDGESVLESEPRLIVNLPMWYKPKTEDEDYDPNNPEGTFRENNYYQIPICRPTVKQLERNHYYEVTVTVNAAGAIDESKPIELTDLTYSVAEWADGGTIDIGGETGHPQYLMVNTDEMEMYNISDDKTTLEFASSAPVTVTGIRAWYYDSEDRPQTADVSKIRITPDANLSGHIEIESPVPTNNAPLYIEFTVRNEEAGIERSVTVVQYPLEYITNIHGWYSYRDDLSGNPDRVTNFEYIFGDYMGYEEGTESSLGRYYTLDYQSSGNYSTDKMTTSNSYFDSKVKLKNESDRLYKYSWDKPNSNGTYRRTATRLSSETYYSNWRMYQVRITASSDEYTLGRPRITDGITDASDENSKIVSPSFLIASQLGALSGQVNREEAAKHCQHYVEVYKVLDKDGKEILDSNGRPKVVELKDWRLPTHWEVGMILRYQGRSPAIATVLGANWYWAANGAVPKGNNDNAWKNIDKTDTKSNVYIRCIHDAYDIE